MRNGQFSVSALSERYSRVVQLESTPTQKQC